MNDFFVLVDGLADPHAAVPNFSLVNLGPHRRLAQSSSFDFGLRPDLQELFGDKCVINARDPWLQ